MEVPEEGEIGDTLMVPDVRADQHNEVSEHSIAVPVNGKIRKTIENVVGSWPGLFNNVLDLCDDGLESLPKLEMVCLYPGAVLG
jgi:hypothetical protein